MLRVSASPHIRDKTTTRSVMLHVVIALVPVIIASTFIFGWRAPMLFGISAARFRHAMNQLTTMDAQLAATDEFFLARAANDRIEYEEAA